jgi:hypothetical protein
MLSKNINYLDQAFHGSETEEQRKGGRFPTTSVRSSLGEVLDLSSGGALIIKRRFRKPPTDKVFSIDIKFAEIKTRLNARVVRSFKKKGIGHLIAVEFIDTTEEQREAIKDVVRNSRSWRLFDFSEGEAA